MWAITIYQKANYKQIPNKIHRKDSKIQETEDADIVYGTSGLRNIGNTCFFNSGLFNTLKISDLMPEQYSALDGLFFERSS